MNFIRPEAAAFLWRWREIFYGLVALCIGLYLMLQFGGLLLGLGGVVVGVAMTLVWIGIQQGRFRKPVNGPGVVQVDEGRILYFGPLTGGAAEASDISRVVLDTSAEPHHWVLSQPGAKPLAIPVNAKGADALFDVFAALPGLQTGHMLTHLNAPEPHPVVIWEKEPMRPAGTVLQ